MQIAEGEVIDDREAEKYREELGFPTMPYATVKLKGDPDKFIENLRS